MSDAPATPSADTIPTQTSPAATNAAPSFAPPSPPAPLRPLAFEFHATGGEYFRIWIVNLLLTIVTIGIYSAWAKVRRLRYFYGSTRLDGSGFEYHGRPIQILKGRLIAFGGYAVFYVSTQIVPWLGLAFLPLAAFGVPWIIMRARRFQMHVTSYRGLRFGFDGSYRQALRAYVGWSILTALSLGLVWPRSVWEKVDYLLSHSRYGNETARFSTPRGVFYRFCYSTVGLSLGLYVALGAAGAFVASLFGATNEGSSDGAAGASAPEAAADVAVDASTGTTEAESLEQLFGSTSPFEVLALVVGALVLVLLALWVTAYYRKSYLNASFGGLELGPHRVESTLETRTLFALYASNFFLIVVTLGLYSPWAKVREMRVQLASLRVLAAGDLDRFVAAAGEGVDAVGEEIGDFFDVDFGL